MARKGRTASRTQGFVAGSEKGQPCLKLGSAMRACGFLLVAFAFLPVCHAKSPHFEATKKIGVLCIGDTSYGESPILGWLSLDFAVQWQELPTDVGDVMGDEAARKITRLYMPRTLDKLLETYDFLLLLEPRMDWFSGTEMQRFKDSVNQGVSSLLTLWPDAEGYLSLVDSVLSEVYPQAFAANFESPSDSVAYRAVVNRNNPPVLTPFLAVGIEKFIGDDVRPVHPELGSTIWAWAKKEGAVKVAEEPYIISWEFGENEAENWVIGVDVDEQWFGRSGGDEYGGDIILNMLYYSVGKPLPPSVELIHNVRSAFFTYSVEKRLVYAVLEFVDKFGASTVELDRKIAQLDEGRDEAERAYMEGDYEAAYNQANAMIDELSKLNEEAVRIKDRALLWVYATEWLAVSGTSILGGFILYSLMVRRRLYREVSVTRTNY